MLDPRFAGDLFIVRVLRKNTSPATTKHTAPMVKVTRSRIRTPLDAAAPVTHHKENRRPTSRVRGLMSMYTPSAIPASDRNSSKAPMKIRIIFTLLYYRNLRAFDQIVCCWL